MFHLRISGDAAKIVKAQAQRCGVSANALAIQLIQAAADAIRGHNGPLIPPTFDLVDSNTVTLPEGHETERVLRLNEPAVSKKSSK